MKKEKYNVDAEQLRVYFPYQRVLDGMFAIYQRIFGLKFERVEPPYKWIGDLQLYAVSDAKTGEPLGLFYLDMFPREGKYNHFAQFGIIEGKLLASGKYQRPTVALICNFPSPAKDKPSLLSHSDVETHLPRVRPRDALDPDPRQIWPLLRHQRAGRLRRSAVADARELGLGQEGAGQLRRAITATRRRRSRPRFWPSSRRPGWPPRARATAASFPSA